MINFLTSYCANLKYDLAETKKTGITRINNREYTESRTMAVLTLLISALDGLTHRRFLLINNRFGPEVIFKKCLLVAGIFIVLLACFI